MATSFQNKAWARVGIRLAPMMDAVKAQTLVDQYLKESCPWGLQMKVDFESPATPWLAPTDHPIVSNLMTALEKGYDKKAVFAGRGATILLLNPCLKHWGTCLFYWLESKTLTQKLTLKMSPC